LSEGAGTDFGRAGLPWGVFTPLGSDRRRVGVAVRRQVLDAGAAAERLGAPGLEALRADSLDPLLAAGPDAWQRARAAVSRWVGEPPRQGLGDLLHPLESVRLDLPFTVADYVDFYSSEQHATNVGRLFRPDGDPLPANWRHLPAGYHGRAGTVVVSGTPVRRPRGLLPPAEPGRPPRLGATERLDVEVEVGFVVGVGSRLGEPVPVGAFAEHVFGVCLVNDWSARDIQAFESVPLGPFLGKAFATSVSAWVLPLQALAAARVPGRGPGAAVADYLVEDAPWGLDIALELAINGGVVSRPPFATMGWTAAQQLAHLTVGGAALRTGDLYASGTVSGPEPGQFGSLLEITAGGRTPLRLADGSPRRFLADGDEVEITGTAPGSGGERVVFGPVRGRVLPARG
jgi:fumarylacetoacetase